MKKQIRFPSFILVLAMLMCFVTACGADSPAETTQPATIPVEERLVVSCLGDSITFGAGVKGKENTYPGQLQELLGDAYIVKNHGGNGRTLLREGLSAEPGDKYSVNITIWDSQHMNDSVGANPDIVIIALGTNDAKTFNWNAEAFREQYVELVKYYQALEYSPEVYIMIPPAVFDPQEGYDGIPEIQAQVIADEVGSIVKEVAQECGCEFIDLHSITKDQGTLFPDGVHPDAEGNELIAKAVYDAITK